MRLLPIFLNLNERECLVVGAGPVADNIAKDLIKAGAIVSRISTQPLSYLAGEFKNECRDFNQEDPNNFWLVVAATESDATNSRISSSCLAARTLCHDISSTDQSTSYFPANIDPAPNLSQDNENGVVSLVGAGPGDPELLTLRALRLIQSADVLVYDRLVSQTILDLRRPEAQLIYAGKAKSDHAMPQGSINNLLVELAQKNKNVVRLKGGDPFIFGRGGEEIETLAQHEIPFQVVPGITAASGCASFSGIPLTHRDHAQSCIFLTGHLKNGQINLNWQELNDDTQTIVVYMGLTGLRQICEKLIANGRSPQTPAALIERGTTPAQRTHVGSLDTLADLVDSKQVKAPTLLIIGSVVSLHGVLDWFKPREITTSGDAITFSNAVSYHRLK